MLGKITKWFQWQWWLFKDRLQSGRLKTRLWFEHQRVRLIKWLQGKEPEFPGEWVKRMELWEQAVYLLKQLQERMKK